LTFTDTQLAWLTACGVVVAVTLALLAWDAVLRSPRGE
jgi:hypothetical protein